MLLQINLRWSKRMETTARTNTSKQRYLARAEGSFGDALVPAGHVRERLPEAGDVLDEVREGLACDAQSVVPDEAEHEGGRLAPPAFLHQPLHCRSSSWKIRFVSLFTAS